MEPHYQSPITPEQREAVLQLATLMQEKIIPRTEELLAQSSHNAEEIQELMTLQETIEKFRPLAGMVQQLLFENLERASTDIFFQTRQLAEQGDEGAKKMYEELKPLYAAMKKEDLDGNLN